MQRDLFALHKSDTRRGGKLQLARLVAFTAILGMHVLGYLFFPTLRRPFSHTLRDEISTTVVFLVPIQPRQPTETMIPQARSPTKREPARDSAQSATPLKAPESAEPEDTAPVAIDWATEAERAAAHRIEADEKAGRRASALSPLRGSSVGTPEARAATPQFGWDHAHIHRVEPLPDGGLILNLNDRCAIVISFPFLLPGCKIGKLESRGDLFTHMTDPPALGDWKDH